MSKKPLIAMDDKMFKNIMKTDSGLEILKKIISIAIKEDIEDIELLNPVLKVPNI